MAWDRDLKDKRLSIWPAPLPGLFICGGPLQSSGRAFGWMMSVTGYAPDAYAEAEADAATIAPGSDGLVFIPYLAGERTPLWDDRARGAYFGLTERHTRAHIARATFEGVAYALRHIVDVMREDGAVLEELRCTGGQAKVKLWARIKSDVIGVPVMVPAISEGAVLGEAVLAAVGAKRVPDLATGSAGFLKESQRYEPDQSTAAAYDRGYKTYRELYPRLRDLMHADV